MILLNYMYIKDGMRLTTASFTKTMLMELKVSKYTSFPISFANPLLSPHTSVVNPKSNPFAFYCSLYFVCQLPVSSTLKVFNQISSLHC